MPDSTLPLLAIPALWRRVRINEYGTCSQIYSGTGVVMVTGFAEMSAPWFDSAINDYRAERRWQPLQSRVRDCHTVGRRGVRPAGRRPSPSVAGGSMGTEQSSSPSKFGGYTEGTA